MVSQARPAFIVFANDMFYSITLSRLKDEDIPENTYKQYIRPSPSWVYGKLPDDPVKKAEIIIKSTRTSEKLFLLFESYTPLSQHLDEIISHEMHISNYIKSLPKIFQNQFKAHMNELNM